jgi:hypothetical protein
MPINKATNYQQSATATNNNPFTVVAPGSEEGEIILSAVNFHCYTNDLYYGTLAGQEGIIRANAVVWFDGTIKVSDWWFKNVTAGSNGKIVIIGVVK